MKDENFKQKYGPWAVIAGGSQGIGEAFARLLGQKGINLVLIARRKQVLEKLAKDLEKELKINVRTVAIDLAEENVIEIVSEKTQDIEVNMMIYNAAVELMGPFFRHELDNHLQSLYVNCRGLIMFVEHYGRLMQKRKKGGMIIISSMSCLSGTPWIANYSATKAFDTNLGEALWGELKKDNIDVITCVAGNTDTPNYRANNPDDPKFIVTLKPMDPMKLAKETLTKLGKKPSFSPGRMNKFFTFTVRKLLSRKQAVEFGGKNLEDMFKEGFDHL